MNVALIARTGRSVPEVALRQLLRFAAGPPQEWTRTRIWTVTVSAQCACGTGGEKSGWALPEPALKPYGGECKPLSWEHTTPGQTAAHASVITSGRVNTVPNRRVRAAVDNLLDEFSSGRLRFHYLPTRLRNAPREAVRSGTVDCLALSLGLSERLASDGELTTTRRGHLLGAVGTEHAWVEVGEPGEVVTIDPMLAVLSAGCAGVHEDFVAFCAGSTSNRMLPWNRTGSEPLAVHAGDRDAAGQPEHETIVGLSARVQSGS